MSNGTRRRTNGPGKIKTLKGCRNKIIIEQTRRRKKKDRKEYERQYRYNIYTKTLEVS